MNYTFYHYLIYYVVLSISQYIVSVLGQDKGYTFKYNPLPEGGGRGGGGGGSNFDPLKWFSDTDEVRTQYHWWLSASKNIYSSFQNYYDLQHTLRPNFGQTSCLANLHKLTKAIVKKTTARH